MWLPFTVASNINTDGPFFTIPATMGQLAGQCGFMARADHNARRLSDTIFACKDGLNYYPTHAATPDSAGESSTQS